MLHTHLSSPATSSVLELAPGWVRTAHVRAPSACSTLQPYGKTFPHRRSRIHTRGRQEFLRHSHEMLQALCGLVERYATVVDVEKHANTQPKPLSTEEYQRIHVWGPVLEQDGKCVGALGEAGSVCLNIISLLPSSLMDRVKAVVPEATRPMPGDTAVSLMHRIRDDPFFEPMMVHKGGCGPQRVQLKGTTYSQPRRKSWSVIDGPDKNFEAYMDEETGEYVYDAFNYTAHGRLAEDWKAYPMPLAVWDLGVAVWNIALPFLRGHSATVPPNACQLCAYYTLFGGAIQRHRDNFTTEQMIASLEKNDNDVQPFHEWVKGRAHARCQTVEYGVFVHPLVLSSGAHHGPRIARPHGVTVLKLELSASTTTQAPAAMGAEGLITQEVLPAEPDSGSEGSSTPLCPPWRPAGARPRSSLSPR